MRIAFIGTGGIARQHARGLHEMPDVEFCGSFDVQPMRAQAFAADYGGDAYGSMTEMLDRVKPDAAWVCLPPFCHGEPEAALLERGIPFLVEKPISNSMDTAKRTLEQVERTGTLVAVGYMNRYRRGSQRAREILQHDPPVMVHGGWDGGTPGVSWWRVKAESGGQIVEQTTHLFDLVRYLVGEPALVYARAATGFVKDMPGYDVEDASSVTIAFQNGAVGTLVSCCANRNGGGSVHLSISAVGHHFSFTGWDCELVVQKSRLETEKILGEPNVFAIEDAAFLKAVATGEKNLVRSPYSDGIKTLAFCLAANESIETGQPVPVAAV